MRMDGWSPTKHGSNIDVHSFYGSIFLSDASKPMMMNYGRKLFLIRAIVVAAVLLALLIARSLHAQSPVELDKVLRQLDTASAKFHSAKADFNWDQVMTQPITDHDVQAGTVYFERTGSTTQMAALIQLHNGQPSPKTIVYKGGLLRVYSQRINTIDEFAANGNNSQYESFLTLGFGGSGKDLQANWEVKLLGMEAIAGVQTAKLDLVPKVPSVRNTFSHVTIWVDPARGVSLKQVFFEPDSDYRIATYTNIRYNEKIDPKVFVITAPGAAIKRH